MIELRLRLPQAIAHHLAQTGWTPDRPLTLSGRSAAIAGRLLVWWSRWFARPSSPPTNHPTQTAIETHQARLRFRSHAGAICLGYPTGADNKSIDADLAKAYGNEL